MNSVLRSAPPRAQAKHPRSSSSSAAPAALANAHAPLVGTSPYQTAPSASSRCLGTPSPGRPHPPVRQVAVARDVEGRQALAVGVGDDQVELSGGRPCRWESDAIGHLASRAVGVTTATLPGRTLHPPSCRIRSVDVGVSATVHDELVPGGWSRPRSGRRGHQRAVGLPRRTAHRAPRRAADARPQPVDTARKDGAARMTSLLPSRSTALTSGDPSRRPEAVLVPARLLANTMPVIRVCSFRHQNHSFRGAAQFIRRGRNFRLDALPPTRSCDRDELAQYPAGHPTIHDGSITTRKESWMGERIEDQCDLRATTLIARVVGLAVRAGARRRAAAVGARIVSPGNGGSSPAQRFGCSSAPAAA